MAIGFRGVTGELATRYYEIDTLSDSEWLNLNHFEFIRINYQRYVSHAVGNQGSYLPSDAVDELLGIFLDVGLEPIIRAHERNLDAVGQRRRQVMLGTLRGIARTRVSARLIQEYPARLPLPIEAVSSCDSEDDFSGDSPLFSNPHTNSLPLPLYAADSLDDQYERDEVAERDDQVLLQRLETVRGKLSYSQYELLKARIFVTSSPTQLAEIFNQRPEKIYDKLRKIRAALFALLDTEEQPLYESLLSLR